MATVADFYKYVEEVFPRALASLKECQDGSDVSVWRARLELELNQKQVQGESLEDMMRATAHHPQDCEESKEELTFAQRIFIAASRYEIEHRALVKQFEAEIGELRLRTDALNSLHTSTSSMKV